MIWGEANDGTVALVQRVGVERAGAGIDIVAVGDRGHAVGERAWDVAERMEEDIVGCAEEEVGYMLVG